MIRPGFRPRSPGSAAPRAVATLAALPLLSLLGACASSSISSDVSRVRELSGAQALPELEGPREPGDREDPRELLREPLDADAAVRIALLHNRGLRAQLHELGIARGQLMQAGTAANPVAEAEALPNPTEIELRVEYDVSSLILAAQRADAAEAELDAARYRIAAAVVRLGYEVRAALLAVQASERRLAIAAQALEAFALSREAAEALLQAGNVRALDVASHIAAHERARVRLAEIELELAVRREQLQRLLGIQVPAGALRIATGPGPVPDEPELVADAEQRAVNRSLELAELRSLGTAAFERADAERTQGWLPELSIGAIGAYEDRRGEEATYADDFRIGGGVSLALPLFDRRQGAARAFEAEGAQQRELYEALEIELRSRVREAQRRVTSSHERAQKFASVILPAHQEVLEQTLLQYNAMQVSVFEVLAARRDQLEVELAYTETLREYWTATAALDALLAGVRVASGGGSIPSEPVRRTGGH